MQIVVTSKPHDGLLYYSYEYARHLDIPLVVITHPGFTEEDYLNAIQSKYIVTKEIYFNDVLDGVSIVLGRSMISIPYMQWDKYDQNQQLCLKFLYQRVVVVYSENHPTIYPEAIEFFGSETYDLCDHDVYPKGVGEQFEKRINFDLYKPVQNDVQYNYIFLGTNSHYYSRVEEVLPLFPGTYSIITYNEPYVNKNLNNLFVPITNLLGLFETFVYTKNTFDPAPRIVQECKWLGKDMIYHRDIDIIDGGKIYWDRELKPVDANPILKGVKELS